MTMTTIFFRHRIDDDLDVDIWYQWHLETLTSCSVSSMTELCPVRIYLVCQGSSREEEPSPQSHDINNKARPAASDFWHSDFLGHNVQLDFNYCMIYLYVINVFAFDQHWPRETEAYDLFLHLLLENQHFREKGSQHLWAVFLWGQASSKQGLHLSLLLFSIFSIFQLKADMSAQVGINLSVKWMKNPLPVNEAGFCFSRGCRSKPDVAAWLVIVVNEWHGQAIAAIPRIQDRGDTDKRWCKPRHSATSKWLMIVYPKLLRSSWVYRGQSSAPEPHIMSNICRSRWQLKGSSCMFMFIILLAPFTMDVHANCARGQDVWLGTFQSCNCWGRLQRNSCRRHLATGNLNRRSSFGSQAEQMQCTPWKSSSLALATRSFPFFRRHCVTRHFCVG